MSHATLNLPRATFSGGKEGGVKTTIEYRGSRRIAFPDKKGPQPKDGETWTYIVLNQNQTKTVWFIRCVALVSEAQSVTSSGATTAANAEASAAAILAELQPTGLERKTVKLGDLGAQVRCRAAKTDEHLLAVTEGLARVQGLIAKTRQKDTAARASLHELIPFAFDRGVKVAKQLIAARAEKKQLRVDELRYVSMRYKVVRILKSSFEVPDELSDVSLTLFKKSLEARRQALNELLGDPSFKFNQLEKDLAEYVNNWLADHDTIRNQIERVVTIIGEMTTIESARQSLLEDLASLVDMYEERMAELVK